MGFLDIKDHPEGCICCWIMGYGVDEKRPNEWVERVLLREPDCPADHHMEGDRDDACLSSQDDHYGATATAGMPVPVGDKDA
jgi:hypothetical protein